MKANVDSRVSTMELVHRYHRQAAYGSIIIAVLFFVTIEERGGNGEIGILVLACLLVSLFVLTKWLLASRSLKDSPKYLNIEYGDYCREASNTAVRYGVIALVTIMCLAISLELWGSIYLLGSTVARIALCVFFATSGVAYLILTRIENEGDYEE